MDETIMKYNGFQQYIINTINIYPEIFKNSRFSYFFDNCTNNINFFDIKKDCITLYFYTKYKELVKVIITKEKNIIQIEKKYNSHTIKVTIEKHDTFMKFIITKISFLNNFQKLIEEEVSFLNMEGNNICKSLYSSTIVEKNKLTCALTFP